MRLLSGTDAFTPALERTKRLLRPFSLRKTLKVGLVALLAEMSFQFTVPPVGGWHGTASPPSGGGAALMPGISLATVLAIGLVFFAAGLVIFYFGSRMQFVLMDMVATGDLRVGPSWQRHRAKTWPWIGAKLLFFLLCIALMAIFLFVPMFFMFRSAGNMPNQPPGPAFFAHFALFFVLTLILVVLLMFAIWMLRDIALPYFVFEGTTMRSAFGRAMELIRKEPGDVLFYMLMKLVFTICGGIAAELAILASALAGAIPLGAIGGCLWYFLHHGTGFATIVLYSSFAVLGVVFLVWMAVALLCIVGAVLMFYQAYALYFMGGRIPVLGDLLEPPPPPAVQYAPPPVPM